MWKFKKNKFIMHLNAKSYINREEVKHIFDIKAIYNSII
jgi:hypothetical protein